MGYLPPLQKSAQNRNAHSYISTVSFQLYRTLLPPPALPLWIPPCCIRWHILTLYPHVLSPFPLLHPLLLAQCECQYVRWRERRRGYLLSATEIPCQPAAPPRFVYLCLCVCGYTECMCAEALTQPVNRRNIPLHRTGSILKRWHVDYYSIQLHQICTIPKWYYTSLSSRLIYPFKWTFISHVVKGRPWRCSIQRCLPGIKGFYSLGILTAFRQQ